MKELIFIAIGLICAKGLSQDSIQEVLNKYNDHSVPYIYVDDLSNLTTQPFLFDAREEEEYQISHLEHAIHLGFKGLKLSKTTNLPNDKDTMIVVYCSLGIRSEIIGKQLIAEGYTAVYNLYGGIFEWVNKGKAVYNNTQETSKVHAYSKSWGSYLLKGTKVYE
ncbi:MAG: rhodanese-like domain-containing protein [Flavobacteriaceae bacterium]|nr:rhodanese-like domain-containing protein [Flavobacteriaceae bacterium]